MRIASITFKFYLIVAPAPQHVCWPLPAASSHYKYKRNLKSDQARLYSILCYKEKKG